MNDTDNKHFGDLKRAKISMGWSSPMVTLGRVGVGLRMEDNFGKIWLWIKKSSELSREKRPPGRKTGQRPMFYSVFSKDCLDVAKRSSNLVSLEREVGGQIVEGVGTR